MNNLSIFAKVFGSTAATVLLIVVFQVIYFPGRQIQELEQALDRKARSLGAVMAPQLATAMDFGDAAGALEGLRALSKDPDVVYAVLFDGESQVIAVEGIDEAEAKRLDGKRQEKVGTVEAEGALLLRQPINTQGGTTGLLLVNLSTQSIAQESFAILRTAILVGLILMSIAGLIAFLVARVIGRRVQELAAIAERVAKGNLSLQRVEWRSADEIGRMAVSFNRMLSSQRDLVKEISDTAHSLTSASNDLIATAQEQEQGAQEQSTTVEEVSSSMTALSDTARAIADNADRLAQFAEEAAANAAAGQTSLSAAGDAISLIVRQNETIAERINSLYEKSQAIINVVDIIDDISDRLDLLALNAALEGSRVGEAGKGFSLVAQEMRRLAENVSGSTKQIKGTIDDIHTYIQGSLEASKEGTATTREGAEEIEKMSAAIAGIFALLDTSNQAARSITVSTQQQLTSTEQMVAAMGQVASVSSQGLESARGVTQAASDMTSLASRLRDQVRPFSIGDTTVTNTDR